MLHAGRPGCHDRSGPQKKVAKPRMRDKLSRSKPLTPICGEFGTPEFFRCRFQTSMDRATVEDSTAGLGQLLRTGRPLVGGLSFHGVSGLCMSSLAHWLQGGVQAQVRRRRPMQAWVSCSGGRTTACDPHAFGGDPCGQHRASYYLKHSTTTATRVLSSTRHPRNPKEPATEKSTRAIRIL